METKEQSSKGTPQQKEPHLLFLIGQETYAIRVGWLGEILKPEGMGARPSSAGPHWEEMTLRGSRIPVLRTPDFLAYPPSLQGSESVLILGREKRPFGLLVGKVKGIGNIPELQVRPVPPLATQLDPSYLRGIANVEGEVVFFLNEERFSQMDEILQFYRT